MSTMHAEIFKLVQEIDGPRLIDTDVRKTPRWLIEELEDAWWPFTLDPAADHTNHVCDNYYTAEEDGLRQPWFNFPCDCLHKVRAGVSGDDAVLPTPCGEGERTDIMVSELYARESAEASSLSTASRSRNTPGGETTLQQQSERTSTQTSEESDRESKASESPLSTSISMVARNVGSVPSDVELPVRVLRSSRISRAGSRHSSQRSAVSRHSSVEHRSGVSNLQPPQGAKDMATCPYCGVFGKPARVFLNPPYSTGQLALWCEKATAEAARGVTTVALLPGDTSTRVFHDFVLPNQHHFTKCRLRFEGAPLDSKGRLASAKFGSVIVVFAPERSWSR